MLSTTVHATAATAATATTAPTSAFQHLARDHREWAEEHAAVLEFDAGVARDAAKQIAIARIGSLARATSAKPPYATPQSQTSNR